MRQTQGSFVGNKYNEQLINAIFNHGVPFIEMHYGKLK